VCAVLNGDESATRTAAITICDRRCLSVDIPWQRSAAAEDNNDGVRADLSHSSALL